MNQTTSEPSFRQRLQHFHAGTESRAWELFGAHPAQRDGVRGYLFRVWAPHAQSVSLICESNGWLPELAPMQPLAEDSSVWEYFLPDAQQYECYKYCIRTADGCTVHKSDPFAFHAETRPANASKTYDLSGYEWQDRFWQRKPRPAGAQPMNIYEVHFGSWRMHEDNSFYSYREMADILIPYVCDMGYTHLELLPLAEYPYDGSWGYQTLGWFAATSRYGTPHDLMYFIDRCHQAGLGVILDWNALGFPNDAYGLYQFDGAPCYECQPPEDELSCNMHRFDFGKGEVVSFLLSSALFWITQFHADGLRISSVEPMLYLDREREAHWTANCYGENIDLDGAEFLRVLNDTAALQVPAPIMIASAAGDWPSITKPTSLGGLGFSRVWRDGWIRRTLELTETLPDGAEEFSDWLTLSLLDSMGERYILPLSHDVVSHGDGSFLSRMPGSYEDKFAHLRALYGFVMAHPGDKLLFMGSEFAQFTEWACHRGLDWMLLDYDTHHQMQEYVRALNLFYRSNPALWEQGGTQSFVWVDRGDNGLLAFERRSSSGDALLAVINLTAHAADYELAMDAPGTWEEVFSSNLMRFGGSGAGENPKTYAQRADGRYDMTVYAPACSVRFFSRLSADV